MTWAGQCVQGYYGARREKVSRHGCPPCLLYLHAISLSALPRRSDISNERSCVRFCPAAAVR